MLASTSGRAIAFAVADMIGDGRLPMAFIELDDVVAIGGVDYGVRQCCCPNPSFASFALAASRVTSLGDRYGLGSFAPALAARRRFRALLKPPSDKGNSIW